MKIDNLHYGYLFIRANIISCISCDVVAFKKAGKDT